MADPFQTLTDCGPLGDTVDYHHTARMFMQAHSAPGWAPLSLDEWLVEHQDQIPEDVRREGAELLTNFAGYGGDH